VKREIVLSSGEGTGRKGLGVKSALRGGSLVQVTGSRTVIKDNYAVNEVFPKDKHRFYPIARQYLLQ
jgi:riboflavin biosynthesis pyrimidine reductase